MAFTYNDIKTMARNITHRNVNDDAHEDVLSLALTAAIGEVSRFHEWWFTEVELKVSLAQGQRLYDFPVADAHGNVIEVVSLNKKSFRTKATYEIAWIDSVEEIDQFDPDWTDGETGAVEGVGISAAKIFAYKAPSADYISANPHMYARGWRTIRQPTTAQLSENILDIPGDWHEVLMPGTVAWLYRLSRAQPGRVQEAYGEFYAKLGQMKARSKPALGFGRDTIPPSDVYRRGGGSTWRQGNTDYGTRLHR